MSSWNDDRLDELSARIESGFARVDVRLGQTDEALRQLATRQELKEGLAEVRADANTNLAEAKTEVNARFDRLEGRFARMERLVMGFGAMLLVSLIANQFG